MQNELFAEAYAAPVQGLHYKQEFLTLVEEAELLTVIQSLPLQAAKYKQYTARRRVMSFGGSYDFVANKLMPGRPLDERLKPLRNRVAQWMGVQPEVLVHALVAEYLPGTPLGWHRDVPDFEAIVGVSLGNEANLRFRPYPPSEASMRNVLQLEVAPRSIYKMESTARWGWQHQVPPVKGHRWSITFRTLRL